MLLYKFYDSKIRIIAFISTQLSSRLLHVTHGNKCQVSDYQRPVKPMAGGGHPTSTLHVSVRNSTSRGQRAKKPQDREIEKEGI